MARVAKLSRIPAMSAVAISIQFLALCIALIFSTPNAAAEKCTYSTWAWSPEEGRAVDHAEIIKPRSELAAEERHPDLPCTICAEDHRIIALSNGAEVTVCKAVADDLEVALNAALRAEFPINEIVGYRVGRTKGVLDESGRRTQYSHHSFGLAIDINSSVNGLYENCAQFSPRCRLLRGGEWRPGAPGAITPETPVYGAITAMGWRWGGELPGRQKDFMHFSPMGD